MIIEGGVSYLSFVGGKIEKVNFFGDILAQ